MVFKNGSSRRAQEGWDDPLPTGCKECCGPCLSLFIVAFVIFPIFLLGISALFAVPLWAIECSDMDGSDAGVELTCDYYEWFKYIMGNLVRPPPAHCLLAAMHGLRCMLAAGCCCCCCCCCWLAGCWLAAAGWLAATGWLLSLPCHCIHVAYCAPRRAPSRLH